MTQPTELTECFDADIPRVDLVKTSANGTPFLLMKSADTGLMNADDVRELIKSATPAAPTPRDLFATKETTVTTAAVETVIKAGDDPTDDLDPTVVLAEPTADAPGDPNDPGSPAWEAIDAATACKWTAILSRAKNALACMADREAQEAVTVDGDDAESVYDLQDAGCAIDYAISILAPFAVGEQVESDLATEAIDEVLKAAAAISVDDLDILEFAGAFTKAGRVLSTSNEQAIRNAVDSLQNVLATLPQAEEAPVTKTADPTSETVVPEPAAAVEPTVETAPVVKAKGDPQMAVFDASGNLVGTIDPADMSPIAAPTPPEGGDAQGADTTPTPTDDAAAAAPAAPAAADPALADDPTAGAATIPGTDTVQAPADDDDTVAKAAAFTVEDITTAFVAALKETGLEDVTKASAALEERLARVEAQPAPGGPLLNGGTGVAGAAPRDGSTDDALAPLRKAAAEETDPEKKRALEYQLGVELIKAAQKGQPVTAAKPQTFEDVLARFTIA